MGGQANALQIQKQRGKKTEREDMTTPVKWLVGLLIFWAGFRLGLWYCYGLATTYRAKADMLAKRLARQQDRRKK